MRLNSFKALALAENREFLQRWRAWATTNLAYLKVKRDLTFSGLLSTRETVEMLTRAAAATSYIVGEGFLGIRKKERA